MENKEILTEVEFNELIDNLEIVKKLTLYGRKNIKYHVKKLQKEIEKYKYLYQKALDNTVSADRENINLKKQINKMTQYIAKEDKTERFCDYKTVCDQNCEECVEAYFREESEEE